jgi:hypothetical protein
MNWVRVAEIPRVDPHQRSISCIAVVESEVVDKQERRAILNNVAMIIHSIVGSLPPLPARYILRSF